MSTSAGTMAFPANFRSFGEMSSGPLDLLVLGLFTLSCTDWFVSRANDDVVMRLNIVLHPLERAVLALEVN